MGAAAAAAAVAAAVVVTAAITYAICASPVMTAVTAAAATAAEAQVPPAADGAGFPYHHLLRVVLCHIGKKYFRLTQFEVDCLLVKLSVEFINLVWEQRFDILKRAVDRSLNCHAICSNF